jgi:hypothetical protein
VGSLEKYYLNQYENEQSYKTKGNQKYIQRTNDLIDTVPKLIKKMTIAAEISHPECTMIFVDKILRPSWTIILDKHYDSDGRSVNLLLDGRLVNVYFSNQCQQLKD